MGLIVPAGTMQFTKKCTTSTPSIILEPCCVIEIQGSNGAGKSSFLKSLAQLAFSNNLKFTFLGQNNGLLFNQTLAENLLYFQSFYDTYDFYDQSWIQGLNLEKKIYEFSLGQQQKIALHTRLIDSYPLWILDEPSSHIDQNSQSQLIQSIKKFAYTNKGIVIYSTHHSLPIDSKKTYQLEQKCY